MHKMLLVEDDAMTCSLLAEVLRGDGYAVTAVDSPQEALSALDSDAFDIVITDLQLNGGNGISVLQAARRLQPPPAVIVQTGRGSLETAIIALREHADDYLLKPYKPSDLLASVARTLQQRIREQRRSEALQRLVGELGQFWEPSSAEVAGEAGAPFSAPAQKPGLHESLLCAGALQIDRLRRTVLFRGEVVPVTPIEFTLLCVLAEAEGTVVEGRRIVEQTHGHNVGNDEAQLLLKAHIRNLRRKIEPGYLVNVRAIGYRLVPPDSSGRALIGGN